MTIKYMWLLGLWDEQLEPLAAVLHVPVDSYIIEAIWHENHEVVTEETTFRVTLPCYDAKKNYKYSDDKLVSWSRWNSEMYDEFQKTLRSYIKNCTKCASPPDWEGPAWIEVAQKRNINNDM